MKKVYLMISGLLLAGTVNAQIAGEKAYLPIAKSEVGSRTIGLTADDRDPGDAIVTDNFSDAANWSIYTEAGTAEWELVTSTPGDLVDYLEPFAGSGAADGFAAINGVQYLLAGTVAPIDALLEYNGTIDCSGASAVTLEFFMAYRPFNADKIFVEVSNDDWATTTAFELFADVATNAPTRQETILRDITTIAAGEADVKVRFRFQELGADPDFGSGYGCMIDDFVVKEAWDYDVEITASYHYSGAGVYMENGLDYYQIAQSQKAPITFVGKISNLGGLVQPNAKINVDVTGAGTYSATSTTVDLPVSGSDSLTLDGTFTPDANGDYDVTMFVDSDGEEQETMNDSSYRTITVNEYIYGRDNGISAGTISNVTSNTGNPLLIGNVMDIFGDAELNAVDLAVSANADNIGQLIFAQLMIFDADGGAFVYEAQTEDHTITADENGGFIKLYFEEEIPLEAGQSILILAGHYGGDDEVEFRTAQGVEEQTVLGYTSGASDPFFLSSPSAIMVRLDFEDYGLGINDEVANLAVSQNMPNPFNANSIINYSLNEAANVSIDFVDVTGKLVRSINKGNQTAGDYVVTIDGNDFAEGVYFYTFTIGNEKVTKRMVVTK
jgi:hypothetical protein